MSAYIVDLDHIRYLCSAGYYWKLLDQARYWQTDYKTGPRLTFMDLGQLLWNENVKSVAYRYPDDPNDLPGPVPEHGEPPSEQFAFLLTEQAMYPPEMIDPVQVMKSVSCYEYQSCEHPEWKESTAAKFCACLTDEAVGRLPGYDAAKWGAPEFPTGRQVIPLSALFDAK